MKIHDIRNISDKELAQRIKDEEENLIHLKFQKETSQLESPIKVRLLRRDIARMKTVMVERAAAAAAAVKTPEGGKP